MGAPAVPSVAVEAETGDGSPSFEVMFLLDAPSAAIPALRASLEPLGDSLIVVGGDPLWNVHVHVDDAGAAIEAGLVAGTRTVSASPTWPTGSCDRARSRWAAPWLRSLPATGWRVCSSRPAPRSSDAGRAASLDRRDAGRHPAHRRR